MDNFYKKNSRHKSSWIDVDGLKTHYIEAGRGEPIVLIHGGGPGSDAYSNWYRCLPLFSQHFRTFCVDMLGFGKTEKPDPEKFVYSQEARTRHVINFIEALNLGSISLVGNSMGGITCMGVAIAHKSLVKKMVLVSPAGLKEAKIPPELVPLLRYDGTAEAIGKLVKALTNENYLVDASLLEYRANLANEQDSIRARMATMTWIGEQQGLFLDEEDIKKIDVPTLILGGEHDPIVRPEHIYKLVHLIRNSRGHILQNCGHLMMMEYPGLFVTLARNFLR